MTDNQREAGTIILDPTHVSFSQQEGVNDLGAVSYTHLDVYKRQPVR